MKSRGWLIWIAVGVALSAGFYLVMQQLTEPLWDQLLHGDTDAWEARRGLLDRVEALQAYRLYGGLLLTALSLVGAGGLAVCERGTTRILAWVGFAGLALEQAVSLAQHVQDLADLDSALHLQWLPTARSVAHVVGYVGVAAAAAWRLPARRARLGGLAACAVPALALFALAQWSTWVYDHERDRALMEAVALPWRVLVHGSTLALLGVLLASARWGRTMGGDATPASGRGAPLRWLVGAATARIVVGVLGAGAVLAGARSGGVVPALVITTAATTAAGLVMATALAWTLRWPEDARSREATTFALVALVITVAMDVGIASVTADLLDLVAQARASAFFASPDLARVEGLQATVTWGTRLAQALGAAAMVALLTSYGRTARWLERHDLAAQATTAIWLCLTTTGGALVLGILLPGLGRDGLPILVIGGLIALAVGVGFLVVFVRLSLALARSMDEPPDERAAPDSPRRPEPADEEE